VAEAQKALDQKVKTLAPIKKAADDVITQRKKLEDDQKAASRGDSGRQFGEEKAHAAETREGDCDLEAKNKEKLTAQEKRTRSRDLAKGLADKQTAATGATKAVTDAEAEPRAECGGDQADEQDVEQAKGAAAGSRRAREEARPSDAGSPRTHGHAEDDGPEEGRIEERLKKLENSGNKTAPVPVRKSNPRRPRRRGHAHAVNTPIP